MKTSKELGITPQQRRNIAKLSWFVYNHVTPDQFDISIILNVPDSHEYWYFDTICPTKEVYNACGTSGCFLGHGINANIKALKKENIEEYAIRCFGIKRKLPYNGPIYELLFDENHRNCPRAAALRGAYFLMNGFPITDDDNYTRWEVPADFVPNWKAIRRIANRK